MKTAKKLSALLLALLMVTALTVTAFAADTGTITININDKDTTTHSFTAYPIFTGTVSETGVLGAAAWAGNVQVTNLLNALKSDAILGTYFENLATDQAVDVANAMGEIASNSTTAEALGKVLADAAQKGYIPTSGVTFAKDEDSGVYRADGLPTGYYLILDSGTGEYVSDPILTTVKEGENYPINVKSENLPVVTKEIAGTKVSYGIGDEIPYVVTYTTPDYVEGSSYQFELTDNMGEYLELVDGVDGVTITGVADTSVLNITYANNILTIAGDLKDQISATSVITVTYSARIKTNYTAGTPVTNKVTVNGTPGSKNVYPLNLEIYKTDGETAEALPGAGFKLYRITDGQTEYARIDTATNTVLEWVASEATATTLTTVDDGTAMVNGLAAGTYYLREVVTPDQYNELDSDVALTISATENLTKDGLAALSITIDGETTQGSNYTVTANIKNFQGTVLPSTGGMGTTIFYVVGAILVVGAIVLLVTRKRMNEE